MKERAPTRPPHQRKRRISNDRLPHFFVLRVFTTAEQVINLAHHSTSGCTLQHHAGRCPPGHKVILHPIVKGDYMLRVLTVRQPFASLIVHGIKRYEERTTTTWRLYDRRRP